MIQPTNPCSKPNKKRIISGLIISLLNLFWIINRIKGTRKTTPINLAHKRWNHSQKKMNLKSDNVKWELRYLYCAICLYFSKAVFQSCSFIGGKAPMTGFHSVIDRPDPVNLVMPPSNTWMIIINTPISNQIATGLEERVCCKSFFIVADGKRRN